MTNIILYGRNDTRLWSISCTLMPKQFVKIFIKATLDSPFYEKLLFRLMVEKNSKASDLQYIVSNTEQYFLILEQLTERIGKVYARYLEKGSSSL